MLVPWRVPENPPLETTFFWGVGLAGFFSQKFLRILCLNLPLREAVMFQGKGVMIGSQATMVVW